MISDKWHELVMQAEQEGFLDDKETCKFLNLAQPITSQLILSKQAKVAISNLPLDQCNLIIDRLTGLVCGEQQKNTKPRPKLFRALGSDEPPEVINIDGVPHQCVEILKHDSWAATGIYEGPTGKHICKFNRQQSIFGIPMKWLGNKLASREMNTFKLFKDLHNIPDPTENITINGEPALHVSSHIFIEGAPLKSYSKALSADFFPKLTALIKTMHARNFAYVDLNKQENILVGHDDEPYLFDFQISYTLSKKWLWNNFITRKILKTLQGTDIYHVLKHHTKLRPYDFSKEEFIKATRRPMFIRIWRKIQTPLRTLRRKLLAAIGIRNKKGQAESEVFLEDALRRRQRNAILEDAVRLDKNFQRVTIGGLSLVFREGDNTLTLSAAI